MEGGSAAQVTRVTPERRCHSDGPLMGFSILGLKPGHMCNPSDCFGIYFFVVEIQLFEQQKNCSTMKKIVPPCMII